jgi:hypothetical protein
MSAKPCERCTMIMVNYANLWLIHSHVAGLLDSVRLELRELKTRSTLLGACTTCPVLRSDLEAAAVEINDLKHKLDHSSRYTVLSPPYEACVSLKGKLLHATKENTELQQEVAYLTARFEKTALSEKMIKEDLSRVEESATKSIYRSGIGFERCEDKGEKCAPKFIPSSTYHKEEASINSTKTHYSSNPKSSFNPKREARKETPKLREEAFVCMFYDRAGHLDEFCFQRRELRGGVLSMLETYIMMSISIFASFLFSISASLLLSFFSSHLLTCLASHFFWCFASVRSWTQPSLIWFWSTREPL